MVSSAEIPFVDVVVSGWPIDEVFERLVGVVAGACALEDGLGC